MIHMFVWLSFFVRFCIQLQKLLPAYLMFAHFLPICEFEMFCYFLYFIRFWDGKFSHSLLHSLISSSKSHANPYRSKTIWNIHSAQPDGSSRYQQLWDHHEFYTHNLQTYSSLSHLYEKRFKAKRLFSKMHFQKMTQHFIYLRRRSWTMTVHIQFWFFSSVFLVIVIRNHYLISQIIIIIKSEKWNCETSNQATDYSRKKTSRK